MLTLRQLRYLDALATHLHFRKAAEAVAVSQPALSMQIRELEGQLGLRLIERQPNSLRLTPEGEEILFRARRILADIRDLTEYAHQLARPLTGPLKLGIIPSIAPYLLPRILPVFSSQHPELQLTIRETLTETLVRELADGDLDAVIIALPAISHAFESAPIFVDRFLLARQSCGTLDGRTRVEASELQSLNLLLLEEGHCLRDQALNYCRDLPAAGKSALGATSLATIMQMVAAGYGVTLLPEICADVEVRDDRVMLQRFAEPQPARTVGLVWRKTSPRTQDFKTLAEELRTTVEGTNQAASATL